MVQFKTSRITFYYTEIIKNRSGRLARKKYKVMNKTVLEIKKYRVWDALDNLKDCYEQERKDFTFTYYNELANLFMEYCQLLNV